MHYESHVKKNLVLKERLPGEYCVAFFDKFKFRYISIYRVGICFGDTADICLGKTLANTRKFLTLKFVVSHICIRFVVKQQLLKN